MRAETTTQHLNELFVSDCLKYIELGEQLALKISNWKNRNAAPEVLGEAVREFSHLVHTLKGISGMVKEGKLLATRLHTLEDKVLQSTKNIRNNWDAIEQEVNEIFQFGRDLLRGIESTLPQAGRLSTGHWVEIANGQSAGKLFFSSEEWVDMVSVDSVESAAVCLYRGEWIPVVHWEGNASPGVAFVFQSTEGKAVILARKYLGKISYDEARRKGAILSWNPFAKVDQEAA